MKRLFVAVLLVLMLAACVPSTPMVDATPTNIPVDIPPVQQTPTLIPVDIPPVQPPLSTQPSNLTPAQRAAIAALASRLNIPQDQISIMSSEPVTWPNGCMGIQRMGVMCTMNIVPGYRIVLGAGGSQYEFHTNQDGSVVLPASGMPAPGAAESAVIAQLASVQDIPADQISVISDANVEWPDSCLGVAQAGLACSQIVTPGHSIVVRANGIQYEYHTNGDGSQVQPASLWLVWKQEGGVAGRCDQMTIYLSGEIQAGSCSQTKDTTVKQVLSQSDQTQLEQWSASFGSVLIDLSDPKTAADAMLRTLLLNGTGSGQPSVDEQKKMYNWAQTIFQSLQLGN